MVWMIWLAAFVVFVGIEAVTMALTTIWFAGGALAALCLALLGAGKYIQMGAFFSGFPASSHFYPSFCIKVCKSKDRKDKCRGDCRKDGQSDRCDQ